MNKLKILPFLLILFVVVVPLTASAHITEACTPGFFKNHTQFITGNSCFTIDQNTLVSTLYPGVDSCVGNLTLLGVLSAPTKACGSADGLPGGEIILLRQAVTRMLNATNSNPNACSEANAIISVTNKAIAEAVADGDRQILIDQAARFGARNNDNPCTIGQ